MQTPQKNQGPKYHLDIEGELVPWDEDTITTEQIIELGGWEPSQGAIVIDKKDNTERTLKPGYPIAEPYGIYVPAGLQYDGHDPKNVNKAPDPAPPFEGAWWLLSWRPVPAQWRPTADLRTGSNLLNWARGCRDRFDEGR